jgi:hypothetical protein
MSEASRAAALQHAAAVHHGSGNTAEALAAADAFHAFITGESNVQTVPVKAAAPAKAAKVVVPPKQKPAPEPIEDESDIEVITKEQVGEAIEAMLNANLRNEAIALFAKYKAKSLSGVKPEDYAALKQAAEDAVLSA